MGAAQDRPESAFPMRSIRTRTVRDVPVKCPEAVGSRAGIRAPSSWSPVPFGLATSLALAGICLAQKDQGVSAIPSRWVSLE